MSNFEALDLTELKEEFDRLEGKNSNILDKFVQMPKEGPITIRILPPAAGKKLFCATRIHNLEMADGRKRNHHCPRVLRLINGQKRWVDEDYYNPCPICKHNQELWNKSDKLEKDGDKEGAEELRKKAGLVKANERYYYNCIVRKRINPKTGDMEKNIGPKILSIPKTVHQKILRAIFGDVQSEKAPLGNITDPKTGRDFKIMKRLKPGKDAYPDYADSEFLDPSILGDKEQVAMWLENLHDLASLRRLRTHAELKVDLDKYLGIVPLEDVPMVQQQAAAVVVKPSEATVMDVVNMDGDMDEAISDEEFLKELRKY